MSKNTLAAPEMTIEQVAVEIRTRAGMLAENIVIIGRLLIGVKSRIKHGEFSEWVQNNTEFSHSAANNFMNIAKAVEQTPALAAFPHSKVLALLDVPAEERVQFLGETDVENLSSRQLKALIKEKEEAQKEAERQRKAAERNANLAEQYSAKYQAVNEQLIGAQDALKNLPPPETVEVPVEVVPPDYDQIKAKLAAETARAEAAEAYAEQQEEAYLQERQKNQQMHRRRIDAESNPLAADPYSPKELQKAVQAFMASMGVFPNMTPHFSTMTPDQLAEYQPSIEALEAWVRGALEATRYNSLRVIHAQSDVK